MGSRRNSLPTPVRVSSLSALSSSDRYVGPIKRLPPVVDMSPEMLSSPDSFPSGAGDGRIAERGGGTGINGDTTLNGHINGYINGHVLGNGKDGAQGGTAAAAADEKSLARPRPNTETTLFFAR